MRKPPRSKKHSTSRRQPSHIPSAAPAAAPAVVVRALSAPAVLGLGRTTFWKLSQRADFPRPISLGRRAKGYLVAELQAWAAQDAERV